MEIFEFWKNNDWYWDKAIFHRQVVTKAFPIAKTLYSRSFLFLLLDDATCHSVYAKDTF